MSKAESSFVRIVKKDGFEITKRGYPDFLVYRLVGNDIEYCFVEVKQSPDTTSRQQKDMLTIFLLAGLPIQVIKDGSKIDYSLFKKFPQKDFMNLRKQVFRKSLLLGSLYR